MTTKTSKALKIAGLIAIVIAAPLIGRALWPVDNQTATGIQGTVAEGGGGGMAAMIRAAQTPKAGAPAEKVAVPEKKP